MIEIIFKKLSVIFVATACFFASALGTVAYGRTEYIVLERHTDLHIFEKYIEFLSTTSDPNALIRDLKWGDKVWMAISDEYHNTISDVRYSESGYVVLENKQFNFVIHFIPKYTGQSIKWTCEIIDNSA